MAKSKKTNKKKVLSAGQKKLASLGIELPLFPITTVGSFPKESELRELKYRVIKGFQQPSELERKEKLAIDYWIREQERLGLNVLVDGEINRSDMITHFSTRIEGYEPGGMTRCYGNRYYRKPIIKRKLEYKTPLLVDEWRAYQRVTKSPLKAVITGPYTMLDWSFNEYYASRETALKDLCRIIKKEIKALAQAGAKIIQIDESAISSRPYEFSMVADALKEITTGIKSYIILHHSYGDLSPIWSKMQRLPVDNFDLETTNSNFSLFSLLKKNPTRKDVTVGIIDSHSHQIESPKLITERIRKATRALPANQIWFSPDCGLKTRSSLETIKKLQALTSAVQKVRRSYNSA